MASGSSTSTHREPNRAAPTDASSCATRSASSASPLYNDDLAPVPIARRNWTTYNYAALWISMAHCIPTYMLASGLIAAGMNWWQALVTILLGNTIVLIPILLNSHPGTKYGIPFPGVRARRVRHARLEPAGADARARRLRLVRHPGLDRRRGAATRSSRPSFPAGRRCSAPAFGGHTTTEWLSFLLFWGLNIFIIYRGMDLLRAGRELGRAVRAGDDGGCCSAGPSGARTASARCSSQPGKFHDRRASSCRCSSRR